MVEGSIPAGKWLELLGEAAEKARDGVGEALAGGIGGDAARMAGAAPALLGSGLREKEEERADRER